MAPSELISQALFCSLLLLLRLHTAAGMSGWSGCLEGQDVLARVKENSPPGEVVAELVADTAEPNGLRWSLFGKDAEWFYLDEKHIRLNSSAEKILDRETLGPILMAELSCQEENLFQSYYRILVEILNENDNLPTFAENMVRTFTLSEMTPVNTVAFTVQAKDADDDTIIYSIDQASPDAEYFRIDLPNSGEVILSKPLDYETKTLLTVTIYAAEMNTAEHFNTSTTITISVLDGDDQNPEFQPCILLFQNETSRICTSPMYTVNVTEGEEGVVLDFSPGPIHAEDEDRGLSSSVSYVILSGNKDGHFSMDRKTGDVKLIKGVTDRLVTPMLKLQVMAYQDNDPRKYSVATALVRVLAVNRFSPKFNLAEYHGFVTTGMSQASLVNTYGSIALVLNVQDQDFNQGFNPMIYFSFSDASRHTDLYEVTQGGLLIARTNHLKPKQKHILEVIAVDQESGETAFATVVVEVLPEGQLIPLGERLTGCTVGKALFLSLVFMAVLGGFLSMLMWLRKRKKGMRDPLERGCVAQGKHPNVNLQWFQMVSHRTAMPQMEEIPYKNEECGTCNPSFSFPDTSDIYPTPNIPVSQEPTQPREAAASDSHLVPAESVCSPVILNNTSTPTKTYSSSPIVPQAQEELSPVSLTHDGAPPTGNPGSPSEMTPDACELQSDTSFGPSTSDKTGVAPLTDPDLETINFDNADESLPSPFSPFSTACSQMASEETEEPVLKSYVKTPPYSPLPPSPLPDTTGTPPPTPDQGPLKATLVHIDTSPTDSPPETPRQRAETLNAEANQPSTCLDHSDPSESEAGTGDNESPPQDSGPLVESGTNQGSSRVGEENMCPGEEDADKNSEGNEGVWEDDRRWSL
ncbi:cadherin-related family member 5 isoform X2 [Austrofundulus limnaeus]|uniref:Cadherin-related family member 5 isoform X2 n=1 Tax=Austrofundulus limnaeus TaxID=52670 RepID=A0A2I4ATX2_AUSLI|nr:PREDICTED: cadherin-related family member 5-like isoform X2 [Austrofundulus limnaeus]